MRPAPRRAADAPAGAEGTPAAARAAKGRRRTVGDRRQCARSPVHRRRAEQEVGRRLHLHLDRRGLAVRRGRHRPVLQARRRLVDERHDDGAARHRRADHGDLAPGQARRSAASLRPRQPIHQRAVPAADGRQRGHLLDEPVGQRLGQRGDGELLFLAEDRARRPQNLPHAQSCQGRGVRLHRTLLQSDPTALDLGVSQPHGLRVPSGERQ